MAPPSTVLAAAGRGRRLIRRGPLRPTGRDEILHQRGDDEIFHQTNLGALGHQAASASLP
jgi:hypothetical protein